MAKINNIIPPRIHLDSFCDNKEIKEVLKAGYTEGVYADTPANRKLGRVGMSYKQVKKMEEAKEKAAESTKKGGKSENSIPKGFGGNYKGGNEFSSSSSSKESLKSSYKENKKDSNKNSLGGRGNDSLKNKDNSALKKELKETWKQDLYIIKDLWSDLMSDDGDFAKSLNEDLGEYSPLKLYASGGAMIAAPIFSLGILIHGLGKSIKTLIKYKAPESLVKQYKKLKNTCEKVVKNKFEKNAQKQEKSSIRVNSNWGFEIRNALRQKGIDFEELKSDKKDKYGNPLENYKFKVNGIEFLMENDKKLKALNVNIPDKYNTTKFCTDFLAKSLGKKSLKKNYKEL